MLTGFSVSLFEFATSIGILRPGFYTPYPHMKSVRADLIPYAEIAMLFRQARPETDRFLAIMDAQTAMFACAHLGHPAVEWQSSWISPLDGASIYTAVVMSRPRRIIEVGSGHSTRFMARALVDHTIPCEMVCIDPTPRIPITDLPIRAERRVLSASDISLTDQLQAGDILFIDSSHLLQEGFDLDIVLNRMLPRLAPGVLVHFHDIFLPYGYPDDWKYRRYNEQNGIAAWFLSGGCEVVFSSYHMLRDRAADLAQICAAFPAIAASSGGSLWLRKLSPMIRC
jgi:predicted O-methyltransferase YrrM